MDTGKLLMFGALGYGAYYLYNHYASQPVVAATPVGTPPAPAPQMDSWYSQLKAMAASDSNFTGSGDSLSSSPDHFNVLLQSVTGYSAPLDSLFGTIDQATSIRATPAVTAAAFWAAVSPGLKASKGLAGLGFYGGLGSLLVSRGWN
jgi:hypothetical protein